ncbi:putative Pentatricopeptide repeat-containing protein [Quillaja saponaria]|uniref:Pentatricopeptide repeat-containing protein n=1 Tax=Quillaja saponaria TaxID=32244 RepID=A0AAD7M6C4_QUISA|nr:putative Pentatricopeptide repeat-containing protein [Quillaja saponaria]
MGLWLTFYAKQRVDEAVEIVQEMDANAFRPTSFIYSVLVHTYGIENRIEDAVNTFIQMERNDIKADVAVYNALIGAYHKVNKLKNAYRVLSEMESKGILTISRTYNIILNSLIGREQTDEAFSVFCRMIKVCDPDVDTYTMMIKMFCERNELEMALKVWKYMKLKQFVPSMHTFSVLINGLCAKGNVTKACVLLEEMIEKRIRPPGVTFGRVRQLLIKEGRDDVLKFLQEKIKILVKEPLLD